MPSEQVVEMQVGLGRHHHLPPAMRRESGANDVDQLRRAGRQRLYLGTAEETDRDLGHVASGVGRVSERLTGALARRARSGA